ncbi:MAG: PEP-CTERM sorting domain-containing protein [Bryobacterales bacterium]|nr:PEP-CTERM sorting domain-containing protein [Bryobacterales bacterium]
MRNVILGSLLLGLSVSAHAVSFKNVINGVWNSGLDNNAVLLTSASPDSHFVLIKPQGCAVPNPPASCNGFGPNALVVVGPPTNGTWPGGNGTASQWVGPRADQSAVGPNGVFASSTDFYVYRMIFNLSSLGLWAHTAEVSLRWTADNNMDAVNFPSADSHVRICSIPDPANRTVCGTTVPNSKAGNEKTNPFDTAPVVNIDSSYFTAGFMALDFIVYNAPIVIGENPTGLRVEILSATADPVPEPMTFAMLGLGLLGIGLYSRRK